MCARTTPTTASAGPKSRPDNRTPSEVGNETGVDPDADADAADVAGEQDERTTERVTESNGSGPGRFGRPTWGSRALLAQLQTLVAGALQELLVLLLAHLLPALLDQGRQPITPFTRSRRGSGGPRA